MENSLETSTDKNLLVESKNLNGNQMEISDLPIGFPCRCCSELFYLEQQFFIYLFMFSMTITQAAIFKKSERRDMENKELLQDLKDIDCVWKSFKLKLHRMKTGKGLYAAYAKSN